MLSQLSNAFTNFYAFHQIISWFIEVFSKVIQRLIIWMKEFHSMLIHKNERCDRSCLINFENKELTIRQIDKRRRRQFRAPLAHTHAKQTISTSLLSPPPCSLTPYVPYSRNKQAGDSKTKSLSINFASLWNLHCLCLCICLCLCRDCLCGTVVCISI